MTIDILTIITVFFQIIVLAVVLTLSVRLIWKSNRSLTAVFLTFAFSLWLLTDLYWVIYDFMRPDLRMPFAVNEIGEAALFLLMSAVLGTVVNYRVLSARKQAVGAVLFAVCNAALWIAWSGEWMQDILIGAVFAYFLCITACSLKVQQRLTKEEWIGLGFGCMLLVLVQSLTFCVESQIKPALETGGYILLTAGVVYWVYKLVNARRKQSSPKAVLCLAFALLGWLTMAKYMSAGMWYLVYMAGETISILLLYLSVRKVVADA